jgi:hypothetical protein
MKNICFQPVKSHYFFKELNRRSQEPLFKKSGIHSSIQFDLLFRMVKAAGLHLIRIKLYSKKTHPSYFLK